MVSVWVIYCCFVRKPRLPSWVLDAELDFRRPTRVTRDTWKNPLARLPPKPLRTSLARNTPHVLESEDRSYLE